MLRFDIFCDASVGPELKGACAGALVEVRRFDSKKKVFIEIERNFYAIIQPEGTNNSGEAAAVCLGIMNALKKYNDYCVANQEIGRFNLFSDSMITIRGLREWIPNWIRNSENGIFKNNAGNEVKNQQYFKYVYNTLLLNPGFRVHLYHQDGHVTNNFNSIIPRFRKFNGVYLSDLGLTPEHICLNNDTVDKETRKIINDFLINNETNGYPLELFFGDKNQDYTTKVLDESEEAIKRYLNSIT